MSHTKSSLPKILALLGVLVLIGAVFILKNNRPSDPASAVGDALLPETQLERLTSAGQPAFVFFHSNNCYSCMVMMDLVNLTMPDYQDSVGLVDVDVYAAHNQDFLRKAGIRSIPTQVFINHKGEGKVIVGVMEPDQLRQELLVLKESK